MPATVRGFSTLHRTTLRFRGRHYFFTDVYLEPKPYRAGGPVLWFGGSSLHPRMLRRLVTYGSGFAPMAGPKNEDLERLAAAMRAAGRDLRELEIVGQEIPSPIVRRRHRRDSLHGAWPSTSR